MASVTITGVGAKQSSTFYPFPPVEIGRAGGTVVTVTRLTGGTGQTAGTKATTCDNINGADCTITTTVTTGAVTAQTVAVGGDGYRPGDVLTVAGTTAATFRVDTVSYTN